MKRTLSNKAFPAAIAMLLFLSVSTLHGDKPDTSVPAKPEEYTGDRPTDYKYPIRDGGTANAPHYHVTICEGTTLGWNPWGSKHRNSEPQSDQSKNHDTTAPSKSGRSHAAVSSAGGTDGEVAIAGRTEGSTECTVSLKEDDGTVRTLTILVHVVKCTNANKGHRGVTLGPPGFKGGTPLPTLIQEGQVKVDSEGTGETIGHIADLKIQNLTDQPVECFVPPTVLESKSGNNQDYVCPKGETVKIDPHGTATVPMDGICANRSKPPVGKGVPGDLIVNSGDPSVPRHPDSHLHEQDPDKLLRKCTSKYQAADKLEKEGQLNDLPYKDPKKRKEIVEQWSTWMDPEISEITGAPPATKDDLKKVVYKQIEEKGPMTPETKKKVDQGIDTIFDKVELTTAKAKDLEEKPADYAGPTTVGTEPPAGQTYEIADNTPTPEPGTQEKQKGKGKGGGKKKRNKYLNQFDWWQRFVQKFPFADWLEKKMKAGWADQVKDARADDYNQKFKDFLDQKKVYTDLKGQRDAAGQKANGPGATQADKDAFNKLDNQLKKLENDFKQDFNKTDDGKKAMGDLHLAEKDANAAHDAEKDAGKNIDPSTKEAVDDYFKNEPPPPELLHPHNPVQAMW